MVDRSAQAGRQAGISRRRFLSIGCGALAGGAATCLLGPLYATQIEPHWIEVTRADVSLTGLPRALDGVTIAQLGDFHLGRNVSREQVGKAVEIANGLKPDLIVLTGDFVTGSAEYSVACAEALAALEAPHGVYGVLGNHDNWTGPDEVAANVEAGGITVARDEAWAIKVGGSRMWLLGIEDTGYTAGFLGGSFGDFKALWKAKRLRLAEMLEGLPEDELRLLLVHNPDFTEMLPQGRIDLALCGHTHGGQVRVPFLGAPVVPSFFGDKYAGGLVQGPSTLVYVNRGIGLISPPLRFNCRPEITLLRLRQP
ncbi:MAG TPA: metallophosphoesterase [Anaerolineae bacterium]|nr:metallophosphoesterase [Anaerolineae bacterium]